MIRFWRLLTAATPAIRDAGGSPLPGSIAALQRVRLGGIEQTVLLRGHDRRAPVLLILHGGPGGSAMPLVHLFSNRLEQHFVVVNWDQRGAGKSYAPDIPASSMTTGRMVEDCRELATWLAERFQRRIIVLGHSWGTELGVLTVQRAPELFEAYIGVAQVVNKRRAEFISWQFALDGARRANDHKSLRQLERLEPPGYGGRVDDLLFQRRCVSRFGGTFFDPKRDKQLFARYFESPEYSLADLQRLKKGSTFSLNALWRDRLELDLVRDAPSLRVPVHFLHGRSDRVTPTELVQEYFDVLQAPSKRLTWFERSGHCPLFEEPDRFQQLLIDEWAGTPSRAAA